MKNLLNQSHYLYDGKIFFIYNAIRINFGDQTPVEQYFRGGGRHYITVFDSII